MGQTFLSAGGADILVCWWGRHSCLLVGQTFLSAGGAVILVCWWGRHACLLVGQTFLSAEWQARMPHSPIHGRQECLPHRTRMNCLDPSSPAISSSPARPTLVPPPTVAVEAI